tara:strand:- start:151 stop:948 length:798 start_codon:yes stop_codon:yes gene_type:complete
MGNILILGTSHTTDMHAYQSDKIEAGNYYCKFQDGELTWPEYISSKLNMNPIDISLGGIGIETYATRMLSIKDDYDVALIEMPSHYRHELYIEQNKIDYKRNYLLDSEFWSGDGPWSEEVIRYNVSDYDCGEVTLGKIDRVNNKAKIPLSVTDFKTSIENIAKHNEYLQYDKIYATMTMINGYLKSKQVLPIWFSWNFEFEEYDLTDFIVVNEQIFDGTFKDYVRDHLKYNHDDVNYFGDGCHLNSVFWRNLVDDFFIDFIKRRI